MYRFKRQKRPIKAAFSSEPEDSVPKHHKSTNLKRFIQMNPLAFKRNTSLLQRWLKQDFPRIVGVEGERHFKESFHKEGFTDKVFVKWDEVQRRKPEHQKLTLKRGKKRRSLKYSKADRTRPILTGPTGDLGESLKWESDYNAVRFQSDIDYAQAHNEGTVNAGRGRKTKIPKRQFMGPSEVLTNKLKKELDKTIKGFFKS